MAWLRQTFSHALTTRAPGDTWRMHSILSEFFTAPVTGEEKARRLAERLACSSVHFPRAL
jgi:RNA exonuclease 1